MQNYIELFNCVVIPRSFKPLNAELNPICPLLALFGAHHILHVSRIRVKVLEMQVFMDRRNTNPTLCH